MSTAGHFLKKVVTSPDLAQLSFKVEVLDAYLASSDVKVTRTNTVGRAKAATWTLDFGIAPDEKTIHVTLSQFAQKLPEKERTRWFDFAADSQFSENFLKMQSSHSCVDDGNLRAWDEPTTESFF